MFFKWKIRNRNLLEQNPEIANIPPNQRKPVLGIENLGEPLQLLLLNAIASQQKHKTVLAQLEQQITQLERDLTDDRELCSQKDQVCPCDEKTEQNSYLFKKSHCKRES